MDWNEIADGAANPHPNGRLFTWAEFNRAMTMHAMVALTKFWSDLESVPDGAFRQEGRLRLVAVVRESGLAGSLLDAVRQTDRDTGQRTDLNWIVRATTDPPAPATDTKAPATDTKESLQ